MELDLRALKLFHQLAREGIETASPRLQTLTGLQTQVRITRVKFLTEDTFARSIGPDSSHSAVSVTMGGGLSGTSCVSFTTDQAEKLVRVAEDSIFDEDSSTSASTTTVLSDIGHMLNCGFIDGWANLIDTGINASPPEVMTESSPPEIADGIDAFSENEVAIVFHSSVMLDGEEIEFSHFLFPTVSDLNSLLDSDRDVGVSFEYDKLAGFDQMVQSGADEASNTLTTMTGVETDIRVRDLNFVPTKQIPKSVTKDDVVAVAFAYQGLPSGYLVFVFDQNSAEEIVTQMTAGEDTSSTDPKGESALKELGNIMASGIIDQWANVLQTTINHSPPSLVRNSCTGIMSSIVSEITDKQTHSFLFNTEITTEDDYSFDCTVYSISKNGQLEEALSRMSLDDIGREQQNPSFPIHEQGD